MSNIGSYLGLAFAQHALIAGALVGLTCGLIGPFVAIRQMAFAVHGASELAFTGAAAGLLIANNAVAGALVGALVVAWLISTFGHRARERDSSIGVILAAGLGLGVLLLTEYHGSATAATDVLFGNIFGVTNAELSLLVGVGALVGLSMLVIYRPLLFASIDPEVALARGVHARRLGTIFLFILALTVTLAAQIVGTLLVLSLAITPAASAQRFALSPIKVVAISVFLAIVAADGGILLSLGSSNVKPTVFITAISFGAYLLARAVGPLVSRRTRRALAPKAGQ